MKTNRRARRVLAAPLAALVLLSPAACRATPPDDVPSLGPAAAPTAAADPASASTGTAPGAKPDEGTVISILSTTQANFGDFSIGAGYMGGGAYLDENDARREGLHASLTFTVHGDASQFSQPDVHEGEILEAGGYRIKIEKINPGERGSVVLRLWSKPKAKPAKANKSWVQRWFN